GFARNWCQAPSDYVVTSPASPPSEVRRTVLISLIPWSRGDIPGADGSSNPSVPDPVTIIGTSFAAPGLLQLPNVLLYLLQNPIASLMRCHRVGPSTSSISLTAP